ncbi:MAG: ferrochelatase [Hyphomonadaceae bacterium]
MRRIAVVLFNLGGPDSLQAVRPFLQNLFSDPAIIGAPGFVRLPLAAFIARAREKSAQANYAMMGGASPLLFETQAQAAALQNLLGARGHEAEFAVFTAMRYWKPLIAQTAADVSDWGADEAILVPLYPQYSSTTTGSALKEWRTHWRGKSRAVCCYPTTQNFAQAHAEAIQAAWREAGFPEHPRVLFSAHGLPQRIVDRGDPYAWQVAQTVEAVRRQLPSAWEWRLCYQSRVGPLKWLQPSIGAEIEAAGAEGRGVIVSPIAFVSEHVETLVELDHEYAALAKQHRLPFYARARALGAADAFVLALAQQVEAALARSASVASQDGGRLCPHGHTLCPAPA